MFTVRRFNDGANDGANDGSADGGAGAGAGASQDAASKLAALNARIAARRKENQQQQQNEEAPKQPPSGSASQQQQQHQQAAGGTAGGAAGSVPAIHPSRLAIAPALRTKDPSKPKTKAKQRYLKAKKDRRKSRIKARPKGEKAAKLVPAAPATSEEEAVALAWSQRKQAVKEQQGGQDDADSSSDDSDDSDDSDSDDSESDEEDEAGKDKGKDEADDTDMEESTSIRAAPLQPGLESAFPEEDLTKIATSSSEAVLHRFPAPRSTLLPASSAILRAQGLPTGLSAPTIVSPALRASLGQSKQAEDDEIEEATGRERKRRKKDVGAVEAVTDSSSDVVTPLISEGMRERLQELGIKEWFAVQTSVIPLLLPSPRPLSPFYPIGRPSQTPRDLLVAAPTGSGKTLAYIVPLLEWLGRRQNSPPSSASQDPILAEFSKTSGPVVRKLRALIVLPTRDLVSQVGETIQLLAKDLDVHVGLAGVSGGGGSLLGGGGGPAASSAAGAATFALEQERLMDLPALKDRERGVFASDSMSWWSFLLDPSRKAEIESRTPQSKVDILITTPGRLVDHLTYTPGFTLEHLRWLILDEADRLLAQSFGGWREKVWDALRPKASPSAETAPTSSRAPAWLRAEQVARNPARPASLGSDERPELAGASQVQKVLFSATLTRDPGMLETLELRKPVFVTVRETDAASGAGGDGADQEPRAVDDGSFALPERLKEHVLVTKDIPKPLALLHLLLSPRFDMLGLQSAAATSTPAAPPSKKRKSTAATLVQDDGEDDGSASANGVLVFTKSIEAARRLVRLLELFREEHGALEVKKLLVRHYSSDMRPAERRRVLKLFAAGEVNVLVASDLIARGIDLPSVSHVISYDVPVDMGKYVHRVGRTARAGRRGDAWALVEEQEARHFRKMVEASRGKGESRRAMEKVKVGQAEWTGLENAYRAALQRLAAEFGNR
ncbi:ATP-dependent RNA helicase dbp6 [Tilletia horrida]|nr:ATP-dependent RNA helicase dbp6 [Tilletia horrida]